MQSLVQLVESTQHGWRTTAPPEQLAQLGAVAWRDVERRCAPAVRAALEAVLSARDGGALSREQALRLARAEGDDLVALCTAANELRRTLCGDVVTYVVNRNINFTNVCFVGCRFCAFSRGPNDPDTYFLSFDEIARRTVEARECGATEVCIQGGLPRHLPPLHYRDVLRAVKRAVPDMHCHAFSPMEIVYGVELTGMGLPDYLAMLRANGLDTLPGTAAEILDDAVRAVLSRNKLTAARWREVIETAHQLGIRTTSTLMYGHLEGPEHWVNQLLLFREIQAQTGGFTEFVPLGFVHWHTDLYAKGLARPGPTLDEHLRIHALARVLLAGSISNIQVSWVKLKREVAQLCLLAGANDYGGTLMEENISREAGATSGQYCSPADFQQRIRELGRIPAERNTLYTKIRACDALPAEGHA